MDHSSCTNNKKVTILAELEKNAGLIERKRQGFGKQNLIYVKNFIFPDQRLQSRQNHTEIILTITLSWLNTIVSEYGNPIQAEVFHPCFPDPYQLSEKSSLVDNSVLYDGYTISVQLR